VSEPDSGSTPSDAQLLTAHVEGDPDAFGELVRRHRDRLWAVAVRTIGDRDEAADAVQDALLSAFRRAHTFRGEAAVSTWLHRIVVNACLDRMRRRAARPTVPLEPVEPADRTDTAAATDLKLDLQRALAQLPDGQRLALVMVDLHGLSVAEAAEVLGVAEGTVKSRCARGRAALGALLTDPDRGNPRAAGSVPPGTQHRMTVSGAPDHPTAEGGATS
jgi:RNA polymerase sigma-70 factor (ECF subfamily)